MNLPGDLPKSVKRKGVIALLKITTALRLMIKNLVTIAGMLKVEIGR